MLYHYHNNSYTNSHKSDFYFHKILPLFRLWKSSLIHISLNISATKTDIVLKLKMVLLHRKTSLCMFFHSFGVYFDKIIPLFRLRTCWKIHISLLCIHISLLYSEKLWKRTSRVFLYQLKTNHQTLLKIGRNAATYLLNITVKC